MILLAVTWPLSQGASRILAKTFSSPGVFAKAASADEVARGVNA